MIVFSEVMGSQGNTRIKPTTGQLSLSHDTILSQKRCSRNSMAIISLCKILYQWSIPNSVIFIQSFQSWCLVSSSKNIIFVYLYVSFHATEVKIWMRFWRRSYLYLEQAGRIFQNSLDEVLKDHHPEFWSLLTSKSKGGHSRYWEQHVQREESF